MTQYIINPVLMTFPSCLLKVTKVFFDKKTVSPPGKYVAGTLKSPRHSFFSRSPPFQNLGLTIVSPHPPPPPQQKGGRGVGWYCVNSKYKNKSRFPLDTRHKLNILFTFNWRLVCCSGGSKKNSLIILRIFLTVPNFTVATAYPFSAECPVKCNTYLNKVAAERYRLV